MIPATIIYGLADPRDGQLRYVGKTVRDLEWRLRGHLNGARKKRNRKDHWINRLILKDLRPDIFVIEVVRDGDWVEAERFWIAYFRAIGANLLNYTSGGEGEPGFRVAEETKRRISLGNKGKPKSPAHVAKILASPGVFKKGQVSRNKGRTLSEAERKAIGDVQRGKPKGPQSAQHRANHLNAMATRKNPPWTEERRASFNAKMAVKRETGWSPRSGKTWSDHAPDA